MKKCIAVITLLSAATGFASGQSKPSITKAAIGTAALHRLDSLFHYLDTSGLYNGNILVAAGGKKVAAASIGYARLDTKERLTDASTFELASVSKQFTATGVLCLVQAGKLRLDDQLEQLFPELPYKGITIRQLLNHTSGLPDYMQLMAEHWDKQRIATNKDVVAMLIKEHPAVEFAPGSKWAYSNTGYVLLASVIEKVSGKSYATYMRDEVFGPLHLAHTFIYMRRYAPKEIAGYAYGYVKDDAGHFMLPDSMKESDYVRYLDGIGGDGSVNTTTGDLLIWDNAVRDRALLTPALWKEAITPPVIAGKSTGYGFGFEVIDNPGRGTVLMHNGGWPGYMTRNVLYLDKDVALIYLSNKEQTEAVMEGTWNAVRDIVFDRPAHFPEPLVQVAAAIDKSVYSRYTGTYVSAEMKGFEIKIRAEDNHLYATPTGQPEIEIVPESATLFFVPELPVKLEFAAAAGEPAAKLILHQNGDHAFKRKP